MPPTRRRLHSSVRAAPAEDEYPIPFALPAGTLRLSILKSETFASGSSLATTAWSLEFADSFGLPSMNTPPFLESVIDASVFIEVVFTEMLS